MQFAFSVQERTKVETNQQIRMKHFNQFVFRFILASIIFYLSRGSEGNEIQIFGSNSNNPVPTHYGNFTQQEIIALKKFRQMVGSQLYKPFMQRNEYLIRWIRDQNFDLENAKNKLLNTLKWRRENKMDDILNNSKDLQNFKRISQLCPYDLSGRDKIGRPVITFSIGTCPIRKIVIGGDVESLRRGVYYGVEKTINDLHNLQGNGTGINDFIAIGNAFGFNIREHACISCIPLALEILIGYEYYYPEYFYRIFTVNFPRILLSFVHLMLPFTSERTKSIVRVFGYDRKVWAPEILKYISPDQLEIQYGGTKRPFHESNKIQRKQ